MSGAPAEWTLPWPPIMLGFVFLAVAPLVLFGFGVWGTLLPEGFTLMSPVVAAGAIGVTLGIRYEWWELRRVIDEGRADIGAVPRNLVAVVGGTLVTYAGVVELGLSPIVAASLVGVVAGIALRATAVPIYCGAFVGMTSPGLFGSYWFAVLAALAAGVLFAIAHPVFHGVGGKLGTTAFVGVSVVVVATSGAVPSGPIPPRPVILLAVGFAALGAVGTFLIHTRSSASPVLASGLVGALGGVLLPTAFVESVGLLAAASYSASFAGMTDPRRIPNEWWVGVTGIGVGFVVVYTTPFLGGSGGKLGTIAFGSCLGVHGILRAMNVFRLGRRDYRTPAEETT